MRSEVGRLAPGVFLLATLLARSSALLTREPELDESWLQQPAGQREEAVHPDPPPPGHLAHHFYATPHLGSRETAAGHEFPPRWLQQHQLLRGGPVVHAARPGKRDPFGINSRGFHEDVFHRDYGSFSPMRRRRSSAQQQQVTAPHRAKRAAQPAEIMEQSTGKRNPEVDTAGFYGDNGGLGEIWPLQKRWGAAVKNPSDAWRKWYKRKPEMDQSGFFGDTFSNGFGDFWTMKKKNIGQNLNKRRPEMDSAGFYGDTFSNGFGDFWTVKKNGANKRRPEMDSTGFYGDTFTDNFGDFWTVRKRSVDVASVEAAKEQGQVAPFPPK